MAAKQKEWARKQRTLLIATLGGVCVDCGTDQKLEFDCVIPCGDEHHKFDTSQRMSFYRAQHRAGNLQLLCSKCNAVKGDKIIEKEVDSPNPF